jgi:hypothetical protein
MKRIFVVSLILVVASVGMVKGEAHGSAFGALTTAQALGQGRASFGGGVGIADATSFAGTFTYGLSQYTDGRLKVGLIDYDFGDTELTLGADFKWQFWNYGPQSNQPFDFAVGGFFEYVDYDFLSVLQVGGQLIGSYPIVLQRGGTLVPYGRFNARLESYSNGDSESNLEVGLNGGLQWKMTTEVSLYGEFQLDGNDGLFLGIDFNVM